MRSESLGTAFAPARMDVSGNIDVRGTPPSCVPKPDARLAQRLAARVAADPTASAKLFDVVRAEVDAGTASGSKSCTKGLLWLKRFLDFTVRILERLVRDPALELGAAASAAYDAALRPYHGYLTCALFRVVLHAAPYRSTFEAALVQQGAAAGPEQPDSEQLREHMARFVDQFSPLLSRIHVFLSDAGQDDPTPV